MTVIVSSPQKTAITMRFILALFYSPYHTFLRLDLEAYDICRFLTYLLRCVIALPCRKRDVMNDLL